MLENDAAVFLSTVKARVGSWPCSTQDGGMWHPHNLIFSNVDSGSPNTGQSQFVRRVGRNGNYGNTPTDKSAAESCRFPALGVATAIASPARSRNSANG